MTKTIAGIEIQNTSDIFGPDTRFCGLVYAFAKFGKTTFAASMNAMTQEFYGKPTLYIPLEAADGGGLMAVEELGLDFVIPKSFEDLRRLMANLKTDTTYAGVVLDSATEYVKRFLQPKALKMPNPKESVMQPFRDMGVPARSDYQTMGEDARSFFNSLIELTALPDMRIRKHLLVTALMKERTDDGGNVVKVHPDLPGAMADNATAMFQTVGTISVSTTVEKDATGKPVVDPATRRPVTHTHRSLVTAANGTIIRGDRMKILPPMDCPLDFVRIWKEWWVPAVEKKLAGNAETHPPQQPIGGATL